MSFFAISVIALILLFAYSNALHDVSNIIATMISSKAMNARRALAIATIFEFLGPVFGGTMVAGTVASLINVEKITAVYGAEHIVILVGAAVLAAISWNVLTWYFGLPSSSSHALFGGLIGSALVATRHTSSINWGLYEFNLLNLKGFVGIAAALIFSPILGLLLGYFIARLMYFLLRWARPGVSRYLKQAQVITSSALAFSHGTNAGQKSMGVVILVLVAGGFLPEFRAPLWVKLACATALSLGALSGGWRIMKTVGRGIFHLRPEHGFDTQVASAFIILGNSLVGGPVSTTHVVSSTVMGVGTAVRKKSVRWNVVYRILLAWILTLPSVMILGGLFYLVLSLFF